MQPLRPFSGAQYDKNMFTYLPAATSEGDLAGTSKKRKLANDHPTTMSAPTVGYGGSRGSDLKSNDGDIQGNVLQKSALPSPPGESLNLRHDSFGSEYWDQNSYTTSWHPSKRGSRETRAEYAGNGYSSFSGQLQSPNHKESSALFQMLVGQTHNTSSWPPSLTKDVNQCENRESNAHVTRAENGPHFQEFSSYEQQNPVQMMVVAPNSHVQASKTLGELQSLQQKFLEPKGCSEDSCKVQSSSNTKGSDDACSFAGFDSNKMPWNNTYNIQCETNDLLQNALQLLSASSGVGLAGNCGSNIKGSGNDVKVMISTPKPYIQNLKHSLTDTSLPQNVEAGSKLGKPGMTGEKGSIQLDEECKHENGVSALTEKLWDGTLQLSSSVTVSAIAFFKSGEKMRDSGWSQSVEVKGKVRLEAFEKYVQDLPRSRTRGLMVMSLCCKEGSSDAAHKGMKDVARKYKEGKRVGFARLSKGVDLYICPHSDAIITILAKYGFFKGTTAAKDNQEPLIGCVVWRKNSVSVPMTKKSEDDNGGQSLNISPNSNAQQISEANSTSNENPIHGHMPDQIGENTIDKSLESSATLHVDQPNPRDNLAMISGTATQSSEFKTDMEVNKPDLILSSDASKQSAATFDDDDDLPEYDFKAAVFKSSKALEVSAADTRLEAERFRDSNVERPISAQMGSESSTISRSLPGFHCQGPAPQTTGHPAKLQIPSSTVYPPKQTEERISTSKQQELPLRGSVPQNMRRHLEQVSGLPLQTQVSRSKNLFDDDDMPEWCPPDFTNPKAEVARRAGPSLASSHPPKVSKSVFGGSASGYLPPPLTTPLSSQLQSRHIECSSISNPPLFLANKPAASGVDHKDNFAPNPTFRPRHDPSALKNPILPSAWRGSRP